MLLESEKEEVDVQERKELKFIPSREVLDRLSCACVQKKRELATFQPNE